MANSGGKYNSSPSISRRELEGNVSSLLLFSQADFSGQHQPIWIEIVVKEYVTGWQRAIDIICTDPNMIVGYQIAFLKATLLKRFAHSSQSIDRGQILC